MYILVYVGYMYNIKVSCLRPLHNKPGPLNSIETTYFDPKIADFNIVLSHFLDRFII